MTRPFQMQQGENDTKRKSSPLIIAGLTGGIASGKSTVSGILADAGASIIDADKIAREVVRPGTPAHEDIASCFGLGILGADGKIDRQRLGDIIFNDPSKKARLDAIVHPWVHRRIEEKIAEISIAVPEAVVILDVPLLLETGVNRNLAELIVVYVPEALQIQRLMARDQIDAAAALARIRSQMPIEQKRRMATIVIDNSGSLADTRTQSLKIFTHLSKQIGKVKTVDRLVALEGNPFPFDTVCWLPYIICRFKLRQTTGTNRSDMGDQGPSCKSIGQAKNGSVNSTSKC